MTLDADTSILWRFRATGRCARVVRVRATGKRPRVEFRFEGDNTVRNVVATRFVRDFERVA